MAGLFGTSELMWLRVFFAAIVAAALFIDLVALCKHGSHVVNTKEAAVWSVAWLVVSLAFNGLLWWAVREKTGSVAASPRQPNGASRARRASVCAAVCSPWG